MMEDRRSHSLNNLGCPLLAWWHGGLVTLQRRKMVIPLPTQSLAYFHPVVRAWFEEAYREPSPPQAKGWPLIAQGESVLILAPTGSGKTLAAFLQCISTLLFELAQDDRPGIRVVYISPLKALNNDISRNLRVPLDGIRRKADEMGIELPEIRVGVRTGDTPAKERQAMLKHPPHILITTPESLALMLGSQARRLFGSTRFLIIDEIHNLFPTKRGVHLALAVEYLEYLAGRPLQRIGLSATQRPLEAVAAYLGGGTVDGATGRWSPRPIAIVDTGQRKDLDLAIELPVDDFSGLPEKTIWPAIYRRLLELIEQHRSTLVFVNNRALAEKITTNLNELAERDLARVHHGSVARELRLEVETLLKTGQLPCLVATSSLELGIDIGAVDLVVQIESPHEVARGLQRVGRAGHIVGMPSKGRIIPKTRGDLLEAAFIAREMKAARIEPTHAPENCLDILAQQVVAMAIDREWTEDELYQVIRRAWSYHALSRADYERTLAMLAGRHAEEFTDLKPRIYWDRTHHTLITTDSGKRLIYTSGGTIPDRGYYGVYMAGSPVRLGELDEEFVHERRIGDRFVLGTSTWQVEEIRQDRVIVRPTGRGGVTVPFWHGDGFGRPYDLGKRFGSFLHEASRHLDDPDGAAWLAEQCQTGATGVQVIRDYLLAQRESTGAIPSDRLLVLEEFRDELGEWRVLLHSPFGRRVNTPLGLLLTSALREQGLELDTIQNDDGILWIAPAAEQPAHIDPATIEPDDLEHRLAELISATPLFGMLFRQSAARALVLPRGGYGKKRTPLWLSRLKAADLLQVVGRYPSFPIVMESYREALNDVFDLDGLRELLKGLASGAIRIHRTRHDAPSPFAQSLLFSFTAFYIYQPDLPKAERRLHAMNLDRSQLRDLLGQAALRDLLDEQAIADTVARTRWLTEEMRPTSADQLHTWLLRVGELRRNDPLWTDPQVESWLGILRDSDRAAEILVGQEPVWIPTEYAGEYLPAIGVSDELVDPAVAAARQKLALRYARSHGPFTAAELAGAYGWSLDIAERRLARLEVEGFLDHGEYLPGGSGVEWCDRELLRQIHRRSLAKARREVEPRSAEDYACFLSRWQGVGGQQSGSEALLAVLQPLLGLYLPAKLWEEYILPARLADYKPTLLDQLVGGGLLQWLAWGEGDSMRLALFEPGEAQPFSPATVQTLSPAQERILVTLRERGALFLPQLWSTSGLGANEALTELFALVTLGLVTNDTLGPIRLLLGHGPNPKRGWNVSPTMLSRMGRWGAVEAAESNEPEPVLRRLFLRHGLLTREVISREELAWSEISGHLERWEMIGKAKRGYFVTGLSGMQYADGRAVDNLRLGVEAGLPEYLVLACHDPANPWGHQLPWPETTGVRLIAPSLVVLRRGRPLLAVMGEKKLKLVTFGESPVEQLQVVLGELIGFLAKSPAGKRKLTVIEYNDQPIRETQAARMLEDLGFKPDYMSLTRWGR